MIIEYKGKLSHKQREINPKFDNGKAIYLFNINKYDLDGDFKFNTARLINHSCDPNCEVFGSGLQIWVYAMKNIKKGEELSYDYGFNYDEDYKTYLVNVVLIAPGILLDRFKMANKKEQKIKIDIILPNWLVHYISETIKRLLIKL